MPVSRVVYSFCCFAVSHSLLTWPVLVCLTKLLLAQGGRIGDGPRIFRSRRCEFFDGKLRDDVFHQRPAVFFSRRQHDKSGSKENKSPTCKFDMYYLFDAD